MCLSLNWRLSKTHFKHVPSPKSRKFPWKTDNFPFLPSSSFSSRKIDLKINFLLHFFLSLSRLDRNNLDNQQRLRSPKRSATTPLGENEVKSNNQDDIKYSNRMDIYSDSNENAIKINDEPTSEDDRPPRLPPRPPPRPRNTMNSETGMYEMIYSCRFFPLMLNDLPLTGKLKKFSPVFFLYSFIRCASSPVCIFRIRSSFGRKKKSKKAHRKKNLNKDAKRRERKKSTLNWKSFLCQAIWMTRVGRHVVSFSPLSHSLTWLVLENAYNNFTSQWLFIIIVGEKKGLRVQHWHTLQKNGWKREEKFVKSALEPS